MKCQQQTAFESSFVTSRIKHYWASPHTTACKKEKKKKKPKDFCPLNEQGQLYTLKEREIAVHVLQAAQWPTFPQA